MLLPIGADIHKRHPTVITYWIIGINVVVWIAYSMLQASSPDVAMRLDEHVLLFPGGDRFHVWQLFTSAFMHAGLGHLLGNMLFLWVFGGPVEDRFGRLGFVGFYLAAAVFSGLLQMASETQLIRWYDGSATFVPSLGASGAIAGVTGAFLILFPRTHLRVLFFFFIIGIYAIPSWWFIAMAIVWDLFMQGFFANSGVAHVAHLGGYAWGVIVSLTLLKFHVIKRQPYDLLSIGKQAHRRRKFRELTRKQGQSPWLATPGASDRKRLAGRTSAREAEYATRRAEVSRLAADGKLPQAAEEYVRLLDDFPDASMSRDLQLDIANHFFQQEQRRHAATAYDLFLRKHPTDPDKDRIRLVLALLNARYLNDPVRASQLLREIQPEFIDAAHRGLYNDLLEEMS
ncbi:MAG: rhomboid family intramembrane serine protease [Phycisphaerales bacterium]